MQEDAQAEVQETARSSCRASSRRKLNPIIEQVANEKGLHVVFSIADSAPASVWAQSPGLDISAEVIKRFDAARPKTAPRRRR